MTKASFNPDAWLAQALEAWYATHRRDLPWRETSDPYRIWISEIILQQTRIDQGLDYYLRLTHRFPTVTHLAAADEDEVLKLWEGLGYYSRARNMHKAARQIAERGAFPTTYDALLALPGVGPYTAAAVASIAFGEPRAVVDGNVFRVLARVFGVETPIDTTAGRHTIEHLAAQMLDARHPGLYNQAIMDFGALWCKPAAPRCTECPLAGHCLALAAGRVDALPAKQAKRKPKDRWMAYIFIIEAEHTFIRRRGAGDIWQGLYEPCLIETTRSMRAEELRATPAFAALSASPQAPLTELRPEVVHQLTHQRLHVSFYALHAPHLPLPAGYKRVSLSELSHYAFPVVLRQVRPLLQ